MRPPLDTAIASSHSTALMQRLYMCRLDAPASSPALFVLYDPAAADVRRVERSKRRRELHCTACGCAETPQWRKAGDGTLSLCNKFVSFLPANAITNARRCGLRDKREERRATSVKQRMAVSSLLN